MPRTDPTRAPPELASARRTATTCAVCGAADLRSRWRVAAAAGSEGLIPTTKEFGRALGDVVHCAMCGHMQLDPMPTEECLRRAYAGAASDDYIEEEAGQRSSARQVLERLERHVEPGPLVDLGCWVGFLLAEARERGWQPTGIEPSTFASRYARERLGLDVRSEDLFTAELPVGRFQAVVMGDVIEHLPDPGRALERAARLLGPAGALVLMLPDAGSRIARLLGRRWWSVIPTHVQYFTRRSLGLLLARHGFEAVRVETNPKSFTVRYYLAKTEGYSRTLARTATRFAARIGVADRTWTPDFRDRMLVIARRSEAATVARR